MQKKLITDPVTGEITEEQLIINLNEKKKISYDRNRWFAVNQEGVLELARSNLAKSLYTTKGMVFHYLTSILEYGNFAPFSASHIAKEIGVSRPSVYKAKKELIEDGLIKEAIDTTTGVKGIIVTKILLQKGEENPHIAVIEKKKKTDKNDKDDNVRDKA